MDLITFWGELALCVGVLVWLIVADQRMVAR